MLGERRAVVVCFSCDGSLVCCLLGTRVVVVGRVALQRYQHTQQGAQGEHIGMWIARSTSDLVGGVGRKRAGESAPYLLRRDGYNNNWSLRSSYEYYTENFEATPNRIVGIHGPQSDDTHRPNKATTMDSDAFDTGEEFMAQYMVAQAKSDHSYGNFRYNKGGDLVAVGAKDRLQRENIKPISQRFSAYTALTREKLAENEVRRCKKVHVDLIGRIVGSKGVNIRRIQTSYDVRMATNGDGSLVVCGKPDGVAKALEAVNTIIQESQNPFQKLVNRPLKTGETQQTIQMEKDHIAHVIGTGGSNITRMQGTHGIAMMVSKSGVVLCKGESAGVQDAIEELQRYLEIGSFETAGKPTPKHSNTGSPADAPLKPGHTKRKYVVSRELKTWLLKDKAENLKGLKGKHNVRVFIDDRSMMVRGRPFDIDNAMADLKVAERKLDQASRKDRKEKVSKKERRVR